MVHARMRARAHSNPHQTKRLSRLEAAGFRLTVGGAVGELGVCLGTNPFAARARMHERGYPVLGQRPYRPSVRRSQVQTGRHRRARPRTRQDVRTERTTGGPIGRVPLEGRTAGRVRWRFLMTSLVTPRARRNSGRSSRRPSSRLKARSLTIRWRRERKRSAGTLRGGNFKDASISFIRYRGVREDLDSRDYFLELGRRFLPEVEQQIKARKLTPKFAKDWGVVMMCHGFIAPTSSTIATDLATIAQACFQSSRETPMRRRSGSPAKFSD